MNEATLIFVCATLISALVVCLCLGRIDASVTVAVPLSLIGASATVHALACRGWLSLNGTPTALAIIFDALPWLLMIGSVVAISVDLNLIVVASVFFGYSMFLIAIQSVKKRIFKKRVDSMSTSSVTTSIVMHNVWVENKTPRACAEQLAQSEVDVVVIVEATASFLALFDAAGGVNAFPYRCGDDLGDPHNEYAVAMCSKLPLSDMSVEPLCADGNGSLVRATLPCGVTIAATNLHACLDAPGYVARWRDQITSLNQSLQLLRAAGRRVVIVGDLNTTAFRSEFQRLLEDCRMVDVHALHGRGMSPSLSINGRTICFARVDHAIVSSGVGVDDIFNLEMCGSDHKPFQLVIVTDNA